MAFFRGPKNFQKATADETDVESAAAGEEHFLLWGSLHNSGSANVIATLRFGTTIIWRGMLASDGGGSGIFNLRQPDGTGSGAGTNLKISLELSATETVDFNYMGYTQDGN